MDDYNEECENCWCYTCRKNENSCHNCENCSANNISKKANCMNNKWIMDCLNYQS